jgi:hypothetical protein
VVIKSRGNLELEDGMGLLSLIYINIQYYWY